MPIDVRNLQNYGLFNLFWNTHNDPDLSGGGLNEVTPQGAAKLFDYATKHELNGQVSGQAERKITEEERSVIRALLEHPHYGAFFELDGKVKLMELFGLRAEDIHVADAVRPEKMGDVRLPVRQSQIPARDLLRADIKQLPELFTQEYRRNRAQYEGAGTAEEKGLKVAALLRDYTDALWARGEQPDTEKVGHALLDAFERCRFANVVGSVNYNGSPWSLAQSLVLGLDANKFETDFPKAGSSVSTTYLAMNDQMAKPMGYLDQYLAAKGRPTGAEKFELNSPLGFMIGEPNGHNKKGSLDEKRPFSSSGLNWGLVMFPGDAEIRAVPPKAGFEFPIDCLDGLGNFLRCDPKYGERLKVVDDKGKDVRVEKIIHKDAAGKAESWSAKFYDAQGAEIEPSKVLGVFVDRAGRVKGDSKATKTVDMWWWGFCDRNTAQKLYKAKYELPQIDVAEVKVKAGNQEIKVPQDVAQKLLDADVPDIVTGETYCGFRFNDEPQQIALKDGTRLTGKVAGEVLENAPALQRLSGDYVAVFSDDKRPILGTISVGDETINVKDIVSITKGEGDKVSVKVKNGWRDTIEGALKSQIPWDKAVQQDGKTVLTQDDKFPVRGDIKIALDNGQERTVPASSVTQIVGETQNELRLAQFMTWVSQNQGMYATDSAKGIVVSNGMRWTNQIDQDVRHGEERPEWAPKGDLTGIEGKLERQAGDKIVWVRGALRQRRRARPQLHQLRGLGAGG